MCENYNYLFVQTHWRNSDRDHRAAQRMQLIFFTRQTEKHSRFTAARGRRQRVKNVFAATAACLDNTPLTPSNIPQIAQPTVKEGRGGRPGRGLLAAARPAD